MEKRMDKKGQSTQFVVLLLVGLAAAVIVVLAINGFFGPLGSIGGASGVELTAATESCSLAASRGNSGSFCSFKKVNIGGTDQHVSCDYINTSIGSIENIERVTCANYEDRSESFCKQLKDSEGNRFKESVLVNGQSCASWGVNEDTG